MEVIINSYGASLRKANGCFVVTSDGVSTTLPVGDVERIEMARGTLLTTDAIMLAIENDISIVLTEHSGRSVGRFCSGLSDSVASIRRGQLIFYYTEDGMSWCRDNVMVKIASQASLLEKLAGCCGASQGNIRKYISKLHWLSSKALKTQGLRISDVVSELRGIEGWAARLYFEAYSSMLPEPLQFSRRSQHPAYDGINAFLNYGYSILCNKVDDSVFRVGLDPTLGVMHNNRHVSSHHLTFDLMEIYRVWVDELLFVLVMKNLITSNSYIVNEDKTVMLTDEGRRSFSYAFRIYLEEVCDFGPTRHSRLTEIYDNVHKFALRMKKYENYNVA